MAGSHKSILISPIGLSRWAGYGKDSESKEAIYEKWLATRNPAKRIKKIN